MTLSTRRRYTGPSRVVVALVAERSQGLCEYPGCGQYAAEPHHRFGRRAGGRGPKGPEWMNRPSNLLASCRFHNDWVENFPRDAEHMGWRLRTGDMPWLVPVQTIHDPLPVFLDDEGGWRVMELSQ